MKYERKIIEKQVILKHTIKQSPENSELRDCIKEALTYKDAFDLLHDKDSRIVVKPITTIGLPLSIKKPLKQLNINDTKPIIEEQEEDNIPNVKDRVLTCNNVENLCLLSIKNEPQLIISKDSLDFSTTNEIINKPQFGQLCIENLDTARSNYYTANSTEQCETEPQMIIDDDIKPSEGNPLNKSVQMNQTINTNSYVTIDHTNDDNNVHKPHKPKTHSNRQKVLQQKVLKKKVLKQNVMKQKVPPITLRKVIKIANPVTDKTLSRNSNSITAPIQETTFLRNKKRAIMKKLDHMFLLNTQIEWASLSKIHFKDIHREAYKQSHPMVTNSSNNNSLILNPHNSKKDSLNLTEETGSLCMTNRSIMNSSKVKQKTKFTNTLKNTSSSKLFPDADYNNESLLKAEFKYYDSSRDNVDNQLLNQ